MDIILYKIYCHGVSLTRQEGVKVTILPACHHTHSIMHIKLENLTHPPTQCQLPVLKLWDGWPQDGN
jgi:hypothetical protein